MKKKQPCTLCAGRGALLVDFVFVLCPKCLRRPTLTSDIALVLTVVIAVLTCIFAWAYFKTGGV